MPPSRERAWLERYETPRPVRVRGDFHFHTTRLFGGGEPRLVLVAGASVDSVVAADRFDRIAEAHTLIEHPNVPPLGERDRVDGVELVSFACDAILDGETLLREVASRRERVSYGAADAFITGIREALQVAHRVEHPVSGDPLCLGSVGVDHLFFSRDGTHHVVGFGADVGSSPAFASPEVAIGGKPTPEGDFVALLLFMRSLLPHVELPPPLARAVRGEALPEDAAIVEALTWIERNVLGTDAQRRARVDDALEKNAQLRALVGIPLDREGFRRFVESACAQHSPGDAAVPEVSSVERSDATDVDLTIGPRAEWVATAKARIDLRAHVALRRIVAALLDLHRTSPERSATAQDLCDAGWPSERMSIDAGKARVYVALSTLRRMGLRDHLERADGGWRLKPNLRCSR